MSYLLDTCIISKLRKIKRYPDKKLEHWISKHDDTSYFLSVFTIGEIQKGISKLNLKRDDEKQKRLILEDWLESALIPQFRERILLADLEVVSAWGELSGKCQQRGINIPVMDGLIAATAIVHHMTLVTENIDDFIDTGARLFNPWLD